MTTSLFFFSNGFQNQWKQGQYWWWRYSVLSLKNFPILSSFSLSKQGHLERQYFKYHSQGVIKPPINISK
jgi:hypothetical protein